MTYFQNICQKLKPQRKLDTRKTSRKKREEGKGAAKSGCHHLSSQLRTLYTHGKVLSAKPTEPLSLGSKNDKQGYKQAPFRWLHVGHIAIFGNLDGLFIPPDIKQ
jgi:hypothetical protein